MTLDEARETLGVARGASVAEIRDAFRRRAREVHPDRHPSESETRRRQLSREFDRAREARDILVTFTSDPERVAASFGRATTTPSAASHAAPTGTGTAPHATTAPPPQRERARPRTSESRPRTEAPRVTIRFDEYVRAADAAGFGPGTRTRRYIDWARVIAWSTVGVLTAATVGGIYVTAYVL